MAELTTEGGATPGVTGYWLIKDTNTGHAALYQASSTSPSQTPAIPSDVKQAMGAGANDYFVSYYLGGALDNLSGEVEKAIGNLNVDTDQPPIALNPQMAKTTYAKLLSTGFQAINFDQLTPLGISSNAYNQAIDSVANPLTQGVQSVGSAAETAAEIWDALTTPKMWLRVLEYVGGAVLIFWAFKEFAGGH